MAPNDGVDIAGTVRERAARELRDRILTGALPAGTRIDIVSDAICPWCWIGHLKLASGIREANLPVPVSIPLLLLNLIIFKAYQVEILIMMN